MSPPPFDSSDHAANGNNTTAHRYHGVGVGETTYLIDNMAMNEHNRTTPLQQAPAGGSDGQHARTSPPSPSPSYGRGARLSTFGNIANDNSYNAAQNGNKAPHPLSIMETHRSSPPGSAGRWEATNKSSNLANSSIQGVKGDVFTSPQLSSPFVPFNTGLLQQKQVQSGAQAPGHTVPGHGAPGPNQHAVVPYLAQASAQPIDYPATVITERQLQSAEYYALDRGNGISVRLVPLDELPEAIRAAITQGVILQNCIVLPKPPMLASIPVQNFQKMQNVQNVQRTPGSDLISPSTPFYTPASSMPMSAAVSEGRGYDAALGPVGVSNYRQHSSSVGSYSATAHRSGMVTPDRRTNNLAASLQGSPLVVGRNYSAPVGAGRREKVYCDKWVHDGVCAFAQQGCKYKHEMPMDVPTQRSLGLFHGLPAWWKHEHGIELKRDGSEVSTGRSHIKSLEDVERTRELLMPKHRSTSPVASTMSSWRLPQSNKENTNTPLAPGSGKVFGQGGGGGVFGPIGSARALSPQTPLAGNITVREDSTATAGTGGTAPGSSGKNGGLSASMHAHYSGKISASSVAPMGSRVASGTFGNHGAGNANGASSAPNNNANN